MMWSGRLSKPIYFSANNYFEYQIVGAKIQFFCVKLFYLFVLEDLGKGTVSLSKSIDCDLLDAS